MLRRAKNRLFREPRQGMSDRAGVVFGWMCILSGGFFIVISLFFFDFSRYGGPSYLIWVSLGLMFALQGTAELLPRNRTTLAGWLRVVAFLLALLLVAFLLALLSLAVAFTRLATL